MTNESRLKRKNRSDRDDDAAWSGGYTRGWLTGALVITGTAAGFMLPYVDLEASDMFVANAATWTARYLPYLTATLGGLAGGTILPLAEWLWRIAVRAVRRAGRLPDAPAATSDPVNRASPLVDNLSSKTGALLDQVLVSAQRLDICTGFVSRTGLERLAHWLDRMDSDARVRVLVGMPPDGWRDLGKGRLTGKAAAHYLASHVGYDDRVAAVLERLAHHQAAGRLEVRLRPPRAALHAKLYLWTAANGRLEALHGSSNLTGRGLGEQGELNTHMRKPNSTRYFVAWFDARWQDKDSVGNPKLLEHARQAVTKKTGTIRG